MDHRYYFKYGTSRGQDSFGYNIVSLYVDGVKVAMSVGVGFDQHGTVLGQFITNRYQDRIKGLVANYGSNDSTKGFYGLCHYEKNTSKRLNKATKNTTSHVDGMCGRGSVMAIAQKIGLNLFETKPPRKSRR